MKQVFRSTYELQSMHKARRFRIRREKRKLLVIVIVSAVTLILAGLAGVRFGLGL